MSSEGAQLTFVELINRHERIRVPLIQRDYAQGRIGQEEVREEFLTALQDTLQLPLGSEKLPLNLDFIYGSVEGDSPTSFQPLDGQQRLTTLFLLHWYLAWLDKASAKFRGLCADGLTSKFSYEVRPSGKEFFDALVIFEPAKSPGEVQTVSALLQDQSWYYRGWRLDPTIQSALVMLDAIHARFAGAAGLYERLIDIEKPAITFQLLDLRNFGLSDDLYIKMNARGKPLTSFETFKARYEQILKSLYPVETMELDGQSVSVADYFARSMDVRWAHFFWPHRDEESRIFDTAVMNLFRAVITITRSPVSEKFVQDIIDLRSKSKKNSYHFFHQHDWLDVPFTDTLFALLDTWSNGTGEFVIQLPDQRYFNEKNLLETILYEPARLGYDEIVQYAGYAQFLRVHGNTKDQSLFQEWMRVVFNLSENTEYNRPLDLQRSLSALSELAPHMLTILEFLAEPESDIGGFNRLQVSEEQIKARLLLSDDRWRSLIDQAEGHEYFSGQIGFLLRFSGVSDHPAAQDRQEWPEAQTTDSTNRFTEFLSKAEAMFDEGGLISLLECRWERALLSLGDYSLPSRRNHSFLVNSQSDQASWKRLLRDAAAGSDQSEVLKELWRGLDASAALEPQLDKLIEDASDLEDWRVDLISTPSAIQYCGKRMMRHAEGGVIYLLRKLQLNGAHAELYTYCLYENILLPAVTDGRLQALCPIYDETSTTEDPPGVWLNYNYMGKSFSLFLQFDANEYRVVSYSQSAIPDELMVVLQDLGFSQTDSMIEKVCSRESVVADIFELDRRLTIENEVESNG